MAIDTKELLNVSILSPEELLFEGVAISLTCVNKEGEFDILPYHSNFISLIYESIVVHLPEGQDKQFEIGYALLKCKDNVISILTNVDISSYSELLTAKRATSRSQP